VQAANNVRKYQNKLEKVLNSLRGTGIPSFGNNTVNGMAVKESQKVNEAVADILNADRLKNARIRLRVRGQSSDNFASIKPGTSKLSGNITQLQPVSMLEKYKKWTY